MNQQTAADKKWSDRFLPQVKRVLGEYLIGEAPFEEDRDRNTDLIVLRLDPVRVGCRIRRNSYLQRWPDEFTIRSDRPSGQKTELAKIVEGWGDYFFYGFSDASETVLERWTLADLRVFRLWFNTEIVKNKGAVPGQAQPNKDGSSSFRAFKWCNLPPQFIVAASQRQDGQP